MSGKQVTRLWRVLERLDGPAGVEACWREWLGEQFGLVQPLLRPRGRLAKSIPWRLPCGTCSFLSVVSHGVDHHVGICDETGESVRLTAGDITVYELPLIQLAEAVAVALGLQGPELAKPCGHNTWWLGRANWKSRKRPAVVLCLPHSSDVFERMALRLLSAEQPPLLLLTPTRLCHSVGIRHALARSGCTLGALEELVDLDAQGTFVALEPCGSKVLTEPDEEPHADSQGAQNAYRRQGRDWLITYDGQTVFVRDNRGMDYLAQLLAAPGQSLTCSVLWAAVSGCDATVADGSKGALLDADALQAYRRRWDELQQELARADRDHDPGTRDRVQGELEQLRQQLVAAVGIGGRRRELADQERLRKAVSNAISRAVSRLAAVHSSLGQHLTCSLELGTVVTYRPVPPIAWDVRRTGS